MVTIIHAPANKKNTLWPIASSSMGNRKTKMNANDHPETFTIADVRPINLGFEYSTMSWTGIGNEPRFAIAEYKNAATIIAIFVARVSKKPSIAIRRAQQKTPPSDA